MSRMEININLERGLDGELPPKAWLRSIVETALKAEAADPASELSLLIAGQERVRELNAAYLDEDHPTDVLSFAMTTPASEGEVFVSPPDGIRHLGEVIVSLPQATTQAREHGHSIKREIAILTIHGVLHLLGYDHDEPGKEREMRTRELDILGAVIAKESQNEAAPGQE